MKKPCGIAVTAREQAECVPLELPDALSENEVRGTTLFSVVSPGTELAAAYRGNRFPAWPGYAAVFRVTETGDAVEHRKPGDLLFCMGKHRSFQQLAGAQTVPVPPNLSADQATLARLMGIPMTTLVTTLARPPDPVFILGCGPVGYLAALVFRHAGYETAVVEPDGQRRSFAEAAGFPAFETAPLDDGKWADQTALAVDCSGHEQAVLDACRLVRKRGEVVLLGVPWERKTDVFAHDVLTAIFHRYVVLRSGWEWELPREAGPFQPHCIFRNFAAALQWLDAGDWPLADLMHRVDPGEPQTAYQDLLHRRAPGLFTVFDWTM